MARLRLLFKYYNNINIDRLYAKLLYTVGHNISVFTDLYKRGYRSLLRNYKLESRLKLQRIVRSDIGSKGSSWLSRTVRDIISKPTIDVTAQDDTHAVINRQTRSYTSTRNLNLGLYDFTINRIVKRQTRIEHFIRKSNKKCIRTFDGISGDNTKLYVHGRFITFNDSYYKYIFSRRSKIIKILI